MPASSWNASMMAATSAARADAVGAHMDRMLDAVGAGDHRLHRLGILGAEIEDVADLDAARRDLLVRRQSGEGRRVVLLGGRGVERGPFVDDRLQAGDVVEIHVLAGHREIEIVAVAEDLALAGLGEDDELVGEIAADRAGFGDHRDRLQAEPREGAQIGDEHLVVGSAWRPPGRGRTNRRPSSGTRGRASGRSAGAPRRGISTGCDRD